jgi:hypothetical protein
LFIADRFASNRLSRQRVDAFHAEHNHDKFAPSLSGAKCNGEDARCRAMRVTKVTKVTAVTKVGSSPLAYVTFVTCVTVVTA